MTRLKEALEDERVRAVDMKHVVNRSPLSHHGSGRAVVETVAEAVAVAEADVGTVADTVAVADADGIGEAT
jgi:hypothetical protein